MKTDITVVLDRSISMQSVREQTISGFNAFINDQKNAPGEAVLTLTQFNTTFETIFDARPIAEIPALNYETFVPDGSTALLDAIGRSVTAAEERLAKECPTCGPTRKVVVILTDGEENSSTVWNVTRINELISRKKQDGWSFVFLGANQDAIATASKYGIGAGNTLSYAGNQAGTTKAFEAVSRGTTSLRASKEVQTSGFFDSQAKEDQEKELRSQSSSGSSS